MENIRVCLKSYARRCSDGKYIQYNCLRDMQDAIVNSSGIVSFKRDVTFRRLETPIHCITSFTYHYFIMCL